MVDVYNYIIRVVNILTFIYFILSFSIADTFDHKAMMTEEVDHQGMDLREELGEVRREARDDREAFQQQITELALYLQQFQLSYQTNAVRTLTSAVPWSHTCLGLWSKTCGHVNAGLRGKSDGKVSVQTNKEARRSA